MMICILASLSLHYISNEWIINSTQEHQLMEVQIFFTPTIHLLQLEPSCLSLTVLDEQDRAHFGEALVRIGTILCLLLGIFSRKNLTNISNLLQHHLNSMLVYLCILQILIMIQIDHCIYIARTKLDIIRSGHGLENHHSSPAPSFQLV